MISNKTSIDCEVGHEKSRMKSLSILRFQFYHWHFFNDNAWAHQNVVIIAFHFRALLPSVLENAASVAGRIVAVFAAESPDSKRIAHVLADMLEEFLKWQEILKSKFVNLPKAWRRILIIPRIARIRAFSCERNIINTNSIFRHFKKNLSAFKPTSLLRPGWRSLLHNPQKYESGMDGLTTFGFGVWKFFFQIQTFQSTFFVFSAAGDLSFWESGWLKHFSKYSCKSWVC